MGLFGRGVDPGKVIEKGQSCTGRIIGIAVREESVGEDSKRRVDAYAVEVRASPPFVAGVEQTLTPDRTVRLGMDVQVKHLDGKAIIDWESTCGGEINWIRLLKEAPATAIVDETLKLDKTRKKGLPGSVTITGASIVDAMMGIRQVLQLGVIVQPQGVESYDSALGNVHVPHYASHLVEVGTVLPAWIDSRRLDKVKIDWPAAATAAPGVGVPPSDVLGGIGNVFTGTPANRSTVAQVVDDRPIAAMVSPEHDAIDGVTFETWVAVEVGTGLDRIRPPDVDAYAERFGAPPGAYTAAARQWTARTRADWRLGAAFGEACEVERKRRR